MSTMEPDVIDAGSRTEGNSIYQRLTGATRYLIRRGAYVSFVFGKKNSYASVYLTDGQ